MNFYQILQKLLNIKQALEKENAIIEIRVLEEVKCQYDDYYKDTV